MSRIVVIGGGPAGLMAAEVAGRAGAAVDLFDAKGSVGRKLLIAGRGGLNLTHSDSAEVFAGRYGTRSVEVGRWLSQFDAAAVRSWARELGVDTFIGSSGRVFPNDMKAAPLLRAWVKRLRSLGVRFHVNHRCLGFGADGSLSFNTLQGEIRTQADAIVLACGGASWPQLGSDGAWTTWFSSAEVAPLQPANCGFDADWSRVFAEKYSGRPVKSVRVSAVDARGKEFDLQSEFVVTATGVEGTAIYALSSHLRDSIVRDGAAELHLDLLPDVSLEKLREKIASARGSRSLTEHLRRAAGLDGVKLGLLYECLPGATKATAETIAAAIKCLSIKLLRPRPIAEAISTAGGIKLEALDETLMLRSTPGIFCSGEMLDWEAPTGGYLLTACFASGRLAAQGAVEWITRLRVSASKPAER